MLCVFVGRSFWVGIVGREGEILVKRDGMEVYGFGS